MAHKQVPRDPRYYKHFAAIGYVTDAWAHIELDMDFAIWALAGVHQALGVCITSQLIGCNKRIDAIVALMRARKCSDELIKKVKKLGGEIQAIQEQRHRTAHDPRLVIVSTDEIDRLQATAKQTLTYGWQRETPESLMELCEEINKLGERFTDLRLEIAAELRSLPKISQLQLPQLTNV